MRANAGPDFDWGLDGGTDGFSDRRVWCGNDAKSDFLGST